MMLEWSAMCFHPFCMFRTWAFEEYFQTFTDLFQYKKLWICANFYKTDTNTHNNQTVWKTHNTIHFYYAFLKHVLVL